MCPCYRRALPKSSLWPPPLLRDRGLPARIAFAVLLPIGFGALCGLAFDVSVIGFNVLSALGIPGGVGGGYEHPTWRGGFVRGLSGGVLYSAGLVLAPALRAASPIASLPMPLLAVAAISPVMGTLLGVFGGWLRGRRDGKSAALTAS